MMMWKKTCLDRPAVADLRYGQYKYYPSLCDLVVCLGYRVQLNDMINIKAKKITAIFYHGKTRKDTEERQNAGCKIGGAGVVCDFFIFDGGRGVMCPKLYGVMFDGIRLLILLKECE